MKQIGRQQCERSIGGREHQNAGQNNSARLIAVEQEAEPRRGRSQRECSNAESSGAGFAMPAKTFCEWLDEEAKGVGDNRRKTDHDAKETGENNLPPGVGEFALIDRGFDCRRPQLRHKRV